MKRIITMITAAALGLMAWTSHAAQAVATVTINNTPTAYTSWDDLATAVSAYGSGTTATIKMNFDVTVTTNMTINGADVTLDLNGQTLTLSATPDGDDGYSDYFEILVYSGKLTINDSSADQTGCVKNDTGNAEHGIFAGCKSSLGELVVNAGTFDVLVYGPYKANSKVTINGGKFCSKYNEHSGEFLLAGNVPTGTSFSKDTETGYWVVSGSATPAAVVTVKINGGAEESFATWNAFMTKYEELGDGETNVEIKVVQSCELDTQLLIWGVASATLDLNGKTLTIKKDNGNYYDIQVYGKLTIKDSSTGKTGRVVRPAGSDVKIENARQGATIIIDGGTFDVPIDLYGNITINCGKFRAAENGADTFALAGYVASTSTKPTSTTAIDGIDYWVVTPGSTPATTTVAKIGEVEYTSLQDAVNAAVTNESDKVTIEIVDDITFDTTLKVVATTGTSKTINFTNKTHTVTFSGDASSVAISIADVSATFGGAGTWQRTTGTGALIDIGSTNENGVIFYGGNFVNKGTGHVVNVTNGVANVQGGTFEVAGTSAMCVYAKAANAEAEATILVDNGTFKGPTTGTVALVGGESEEEYPPFDINVAGAISLVGSAKAAEATSEYLATKEGDEYTATDNYKFKLDATAGENTYKIVLIDWATLKVTWDDNVTAFTVTEKTTSESTNVVISADLGEYTEKYDKDENESVSLTVTCKDGYELDMGNASLSNIVMMADKTIAIKTKAKAAATGVATVTIDGTPTSYETWALVDAAIKNASSATIKLNQDLERDGVITFASGNITLDLNGKTITASDKILAYNNLMDVGGGATLTITDTSEDKAGRLVATKDNVSAVSVAYGGTLNIEAGTYDGKVNLGLNGNLAISGGSFLASKNGGTTSFSLSGYVASTSTKPTSTTAIDGTDYWVVTSPEPPAPFTGTVTVDGAPKDVTTWVGVQEIVTNATLGAISITLGEDMKMSETLYITNPNVTLDLMGKTLTLEAGVDIWVQNDADNNHGSLTINDSSTEQTGLIQKEGTSSDQGIWSQPNTKIVINAGKFDVKVDSLEQSDRQKNITINGGSFSTAKFDTSSFSLKDCVNANATCEKNKAGDYWVVTLPFATLTIDGGPVECRSMSELISNIENLKSGSTAVVKLNEVIELNDQFKVPTGANVTLDLNGQTLTTKKTSTQPYILTAYGTLTITDSSAAKTGCIVPSTDGTSEEGISVDDGTLIIDEGIIDVYIGSYNDYKITLNGGSYSKEIYSDTQLKNYAPAGSSVTENATKDHWVLTSPVATVTINGNDTPCMTWADVASAIAKATSGTASITLNKSFETSEALRISGSLDVALDLNGKTLTVAGAKVSALSLAGTSKLTINDSSEEKTGGFVNGTGDSDWGDLLVCSGTTLVINDGTYDAKVGYEGTGVIEIYGGKFSKNYNSIDGDFALPLAIKDGKTATADGDYWVIGKPAFTGTVTIDGVETPVSSWAELVTVVSNKTSGTVEIKLDESNAVETVSTLYIGGADVTLDLNGQTLTLGDEAIIDVAGGTLTINDSSTNKTGRVTFNETDTEADYEHGILSDDEAKLIINAGTFDVVVYGNPAEINGGKFIAKYNTDDGDEDTAEAYLLDGSVSTGHSAVKQTVDGVEYWVVVDFEIKKETATEAAAEYTYETTADGTVKITGVVNPTLQDGTLVIPDMIDGKFVTEIAPFAFTNSTLGITSVTLPICCTNIGKRAFSGIKTLASIKFANEVRDWQNLTNLASLTIGQYAFAAAQALTSVTLPSYVTEIKDYAFMDCRKLTSVTCQGTPTVGKRPFRRAGVEAGLTKDLEMTMSAPQVTGNSVRLTMALTSNSLWGALEAKSLSVSYRPTLDAEPTTLTPTAVESAADGSVTVEVTTPEGSSSGFFQATLNTED